MAATQTYANHRRFRVLYHFVAGPILLTYFIYTLVKLAKGFIWPNILASLVALALLIVFLYSRLMANTVQDRIIRLEERLRLARLLPADLQGKVNDFTLDQLVGLRFASDAELPDLARTVLQQGIVGRDAIKKMVKEWRPDHLRT